MMHTAVFVIFSLSIGYGQQIPIPDYSVYNISLKNNVNRIYFKLESKVFIDPQDGDLNNLKLDWLSGSNNLVGSTNWIQLHKQTNHLIGYISPDLYKNYPIPDGYKYILKATDSDGNFNTKIYYIKLIDSAPIQPYYLQTLTLQSASSLINIKNNVEILFLIQENKLFNYNTVNNQGIVDINSITTHSLTITKSAAIINIVLIWSSNIFLGTECPIDVINTFRSQILNNNRVKYTSIFQPEYTVMSLEESLQGKCSSSSLKPPTIGVVQWNSITVSFGVLFSFDVPAQLFTSPSGSTMNLRIELRTLNGNGVDASNWITFTGNNFNQGSIKIEGYATYTTAVKQTQYSFNVVAITPFYMEATRRLQVNIMNFQAQEYEYVVSFSSTSKVNGPYVSFINGFITELSLLLSVSRDTLIVISFDNNQGSSKIEWTLKNEISCDRWKTFKAILFSSTNGPSTKLSIAMNNIRFFLSSAIMLKDKSCDKKPIPDALSFTLNLKSNDYRFVYQLPSNTFVDMQDGDINNLKLDWFTDSNVLVDSSNWIHLNKRTKQLYGYTTRDLYNKYPPVTGFKFILRAMDKDQNIGIKSFFIKLINLPTPSPSYIQTITLSSVTMDIYSQNYVDILFDLQERIFAYSSNNGQGIPTVNSLMTESFKVEQLVGRINIILTWSSTIFVLFDCPIENINVFRATKHHDSKNKFIAQFVPKYSVSDINEALQASCSLFSLQPPIQGVITWELLNANFGVPLSFDIPEQLFLSPYGSKMNLKLEIRSESGVKVESTNWVQLSEAYLNNNLKLQGYASYKVSSEKLIYTYQIVAMTPFNAESAKTFRIKINNFQPITTLWEVTMQSKIPAINYGSWVNNFIIKISRFLNISPSAIIILHFVEQFDCYEIKWTIKNAEALTCDRLKVYTNKISYNNEASLQFAKLMNELNYPLALLKIENIKACSKPPVINKSLGTLPFQFQTFYEFVIPFNSYTDPNGNQLQYSIEYNNPFLSSYWLTVDSNKIYGVPIVDQLNAGQTYEYYLNIKDSNKNIVKDKFYIYVDSTAPLYTYLYKIRFEYSSKYQSLSTALYSFINKLVDYFGDINRNQLLINQVIAIPSSNILNVFYYNTSFKINPCDRNSFIHANLKLFNGKDVNPNLISNLKPDFNVLEITSTRNNKCVRNLYPTVNIGYLRDGSKTPTGPFNIKWGEYFSQQIKSDLFRDEEDGKTRFLSLSLARSIQRTELPIDSWINLNKSTQTVYAVPNDQTYQALSFNTKLTYILTATDSAGASVNIEYVFNPTAWIQNNLYSVRFYLNIFGISRQSYAQQLNQIIPSLESLLGTMYKNNICVRTYKVVTQNFKDGTAELLWVPCNLSQQNCDLTKISELRKIFFMSETTLINPDIKIKLPYVQVNNIIDQTDSKCSNSPPRVLNPVPSLSISFCGLNVYLIPDNTFFDEQDGYSRNLKLKLYKSNNQELDEWIYFDANSQKIKTLLTRDFYMSGNFQQTSTFVLEAMDSSLLKVSQVFTITIMDTPPQIDYKISLQTQILFSNQNNNPFILLAEKLGDYFRDEGRGFEAISKRITSTGLTLFEFGNCSIPFSNCNNEKQQSYQSMIKNFDETFKQSFRNILSPEFQQITLSDTVLRACSLDEPPKLINKIGAVYVNIRKTSIIQIPSNTFYDDVDGDTRNLKLELQNINNMQLAENFWISFDETKQSMTVIATKKIAISYQSKITLKLTAYDSKQQSTSQNIDIFITYPQQQRSHYFRMQFTIIDSMINNFVFIYNKLRNEILNFFYDQIDNIRYFSASKYFSSTIVVEWNNASISNTVCENSKIQYLLQRIFTNQNINNNFRNALSSFRISQLVFNYDGVCQNNQNTPVVRTQIPVLKVTFCSNIHYNIPENTFYDNIDGSTRNLKLTLTKTDGSVLGSMIYLNPISQTLIFVPYETVLIGVVFPHTLFYTLKATNKRGLSVSTPLTITIQQKTSPYSFYYQLSAITIQNQQVVSNPEILYDIQTKTNQYLNYYSTNNIRNNIRIIDIITPSQTDIKVKLTVCSLPYTPCDNNNINLILSKILNQNQNNYNDNYRSILLPRIQLYSLTTFKVGPCQSQNNPPTQYLPIPDTTLTMCSTFKYRLNSQIFNDAEDGHDLKYSIIRINNQPISSSETWINSRPNKDILATINNNVLSANKIYRLTVRAYDSSQLFVDANWNIEITGIPSQTHYIITLYLTSKLPIEAILIEKYYIATFINNFFNDNVTNIIQMNVVGSNNIELSWSSCSLPQYCDPNAASILFMNMKIENHIVEKFQEAFMNRYVLNDVRMSTQEKCEGPLSPPKPKYTEWQLNLNQCGGLQLSIPGDLFLDAEDGNTRNLYLELVTMDVVDWLYLDSTKQILYAFPTLNELTAYQQYPRSFKLKATDKSGLSSTVNIIFTVQIQVNPKYTFTFKFNKLSANQYRIEELTNIATKVSSYINKPLTNIGVISYSTISMRSEFVFADCSISYSPCDIASLTSLKDQFIDSRSGIVQQIFKTFMLPQYNIQTASVKSEYPCSDTLPSRPKVINPLPSIKIPLCSYFNYVIPDNTFYDDQDGSTRNLKLTVTLSNGMALNSNSWIQFKQSDQLVHAYPTINIAENNLNGVDLILKATDTTDLSITTTVKVIIEGSSNVYKECQIRTDFSTYQYSNNLIDRLSDVSKKLRQYFSLQSEKDIIIISYNQITQTNFQIYWSYCPLMYQQQTDPNFINPYDFITNVLMKLYNSDRKTINPLFSSAFGNMYTVLKVEKYFTGRCSNLPPILIPNTPPISITLPSCGYTQRLIPDNIFYDFEQGGANNLKLNFYDQTSSSSVAFDNWINIDRNSKSIVAICDDDTRKLVPTVFNYLLEAVDNMNQKANIKVQVQKFQQISKELSPFDITFLMEYKGIVDRPLVYQSMYLSQRIKSFYQLNPTDEILIKSYDVSPGVTEYRKLTWTVCNYETCNSNVLAQTKKLYNNGRLDQRFVNMFLNDFIIKRVYYSSIKCSPAVLPPRSDITIPTLRVKYCTPFTYNLSSSIFVDSTDGNANSLNIKYVDTRNNPVAMSSFTQFNPSTLQLYAINVQSLSTQTKYLNQRLIGYNSAFLPATKSVNFEFDENSFIADCPMVIKFQYKYMSTKVSHLDVLWKFITYLNDYYNDKTMQIKVIEFQYLQGSTFHFQWTNCSFTLSSTEEGPNEIQKMKIMQVYAKIIDTNTKAVSTNFKNFLNKYFLIDSVNTDYNCIQKGPYPKVNMRVIRSASVCQEFQYVIPNDLFLDENDGDVRNMRISLAYMNRQPVDNNEWIQVDESNRMAKLIYGRVTENVINNQPYSGYKYFIVCTDTSGRNATLEIVVTIESYQANAFANEFLIGFKNNWQGSMSYAKALSVISSKVYKYIYPNSNQKNLFVKSFTEYSSLYFSLCDAACDEQTWNNIMDALQLVNYQSTPKNSLIYALQPEYTVKYVFISTPKCLPNNNQPIIPQDCDNFQIPLCGWFELTISSNCFIDGQGRSTRNFLLELITQGDSRLSQWLQFDAPSQSIYGIPISNQVYTQYQYFNIKAKHPESGNSAIKQFTVEVQDQNTLTTVYDKVCKIKLILINSIKKDTKDVKLIKNILDKLSSFIQASSSSFQIESFTKSQNVVSLTYTNCTWINILQNNNGGRVKYLQEVKNNLEKYFIISGTQVVDMKEDFKAYLKPEFTYRNIQLSEDCIESSTLNPIPGNDISIHLKNTCGKFSYQVLDDAFIDPKYGNAKNLQLQILDNFFQIPNWIYIDEMLNIIGILDQDIYNNRPVSGYNFKLTATNNDGLRSSLNVRVVFPILSQWTNEIITMKIRMVTVPSSSQLKILNDKKMLLESIEKSVFYENLKNNFYYKDYTITDGTSVSTTVSYCDQCAIDFYLMASEVNKNLSKFKSFLNQYFSILDITISIPLLSGFAAKCENSQFNPRVPMDIEFKYCGDNEVSLSRYFGSTINEYNVTFTTDKKAKVQKNSWVNLLTSPYRIAGYPKPVDRYLQTNSGYLFSINVYIGSTKLLGTLQFSMKITGSESQNKQKYNLIFDTKSSTRQSDVFYINSIWNGIQDYLQIYRMQHIALTYVTKLNQYQRFIISWYFCDIPLQCNTDISIDVASKLFNNQNGQINNNLKNKIMQFDLKSIGSSCNNTRPVVPKEYTIEVPQCGYYQHKLSNEFAYDNEDGYLDQLEVRLVNTDASEITKDSWIQIDVNRRIIVAFPNHDVVVENTINKRQKFNILVTDRAGQVEKTVLNVKIVNKTDSFYELSISFKSSYSDEVTYLQIQKELIEAMSRYINSYNINDYSIVSFTKAVTKDVFVLKLQNCKIKAKICSSEDIELKRINKILGSGGNAITENFKNYIYSTTGNKILPLFFNQESKYGIDVQPVLSQLNQLNITVSHCNPVKYAIPSSLFIDDDSDNLKYTIETLSNVRLPDNYWIGSYEKSLYIIPYGDIVKKGLYKFKLVATDRCGASANTMININVIDSSIDTDYSSTLYLTANTNLPSTYIASTVTDELIKCFKDTESYVQILSFKRNNLNFEYEWTNCSLQSQPCNFEIIEKIQSNIYDGSKTVKQDFYDCFKKFQLTNIVESNCINTNSTKPVVRLQPKFPIKFCEKFNKQIDINTFFDYEDGNTRNLKLELFSEELSPLSTSSFIQFDGKTQTVYGYPRSSLTPEDIKRELKFKLKATDRSGGYALTDVFITFTDTNPVINYAVSIEIDNSAKILNKAMVDTESKILSLLQTYFETKLNNVDVTQLTDNFKLQFSFCDIPQTCDCSKIKKYREMIFPKQKMIQYFQNEFKITSVIENFYNSCNEEENKPKLLDDDGIYIERLTIGAYNSKVIRANQFYDQQEGYTNNLTMRIENIEHTVLPIDYWITINNENNQTKICSLMTYRDFNRWLLDNNLREKYNQQITDSDIYFYQYFIIAQDSCGFQAELYQNSTLKHFEYQHSLTFSFNLVMNIDKYKLASNCTLLETLLNKISTFGNKNDVFIVNIDHHNETRNRTFIEWGYRELSEDNCDNETISKLQDTFLTADKKEATPSFVNYMRPEFDVFKLTNTSENCAERFIGTNNDHSSFPWWIMWLIIALALFFLLLWFCWICCPRCCKCCFSKTFCCGPCSSCLSPDGNYSSFKNGADVEDGLAANPNDVEQGALANPNDEGVFQSKPFENEAPEGGVLAQPRDSDEDQPKKVDDPFGGVMAQPRDSDEGRPKKGATSQPKDDPFGGVMAQPRDSDESRKPKVLPQPNADPFGNVLAQPRDSDEPTFNSAPFAAPRRLLRPLTANQANQPTSEQLRKLPQPPGVNSRYGNDFTEEKYRDARNASVTRYRDIKNVDNYRDVRNTYVDNYRDVRNTNVDNYRDTNDNIGRQPLSANDIYMSEIIERRTRKQDMPRDVYQSETHDYIDNYDNYNETRDIVNRRYRIPSINENQRSRNYRYVDALVDPTIILKGRNNSKRTRLRSEGEVTYKRKNYLTNEVPSNYNESIVYIDDQSDIYEPRVVRKRYKKKHKSPVKLIIEETLPRIVKKKRYKTMEYNRGDHPETYYDQVYIKDKDTRKRNRSNKDVYTVNRNVRKDTTYDIGNDLLIDKRKRRISKMKLTGTDLESGLSEEVYFSPRFEGRQVYSRDKPSDINLVANSRKLILTDKNRDINLPRSLRGANLAGTSRLINRRFSEDSFDTLRDDTVKIKRTITADNKLYKTSNNERITRDSRITLDSKAPRDNRYDVFDRLEGNRTGKLYSNDRLISRQRKNFRGIDYDDSVV